MPPRRPSLKKSLRAIERAFADIETTLAQLASRVRHVERQAEAPSHTPPAAGHRLHISPKRRAQLKLQGAYMGYVCQLGPRQKLRVKAVKEKRGFEAAIRVAKSVTRR